MMKKVLYGVAMALLACGPVCTLQSCKDDVSDLKTQTEFDLDELRMLLQKQQSDLSDQLQKIGANRYDINKIYGLLGNYATVAWVNGKLTDLQRDIDAKVSKLQQDFNKDLVKLGTTVESNGHRIDMLEAEQAAQFAQISNALKELRDKDAYLTTKVDQLYDLLGNYVTQDQFARLVGRIDALWGRVEIIEQKLPEIEAAIATLPGMQEEIEANARSIQRMKAQIYDLKNEINDLRNDLELLKGDVDALSKRVDSLAYKMDYLLDSDKKRVSAILIQGVNSPVFGDFSLPIGVKSNILFNWYGFNKASQPITFPDVNSQFGVKGYAPANITGTPNGTITIPASSNYPNEVSLGTTYVTVNPLGAEFSDESLSIVNSQNVELPFKLKLKKSDKVLTHGYTRGDTVKYALYEAEAVIDPTNKTELDAVRVSVDDRLESAFKDAFKDPSKRTAVELMKALYNQFNGMLPAYALRYDWSASNGLDSTDPNFSANSFKVLSQYDLAVATAHPLGYNFLVSESSDKKIPTIGAIENIIYNLKDKINIEIKPIKLQNLTINLDSVNVEVSTKDVNLMMIIPNIAIVDGGQFDGYTYDLVLSSKEKPADMTAKEFAEKNLGSRYDPNKTYDYQQITGLTALDDAISKGIKSGLKNAGKDISSQIEKELTNQINTQIIAELQKNINDQIKGIVDDLADELNPYFNKVNRAFDLYNKIANKVNNFLKNPNHYLQVTALYDMGDTYGFVSGKYNDPTEYNGNGEFNIYLTSYTGELIVPAYKKYVAVTGVVNGDKVDPIAVDNDYNSGDLNTVLDGNRIRVKVNAAKFEKDKTYEFTYQAVDYRGYTSTKKFYVRIAK